MAKLALVLTCTSLNTHIPVQNIDVHFPIGFNEVLLLLPLLLLLLLLLIHKVALTVSAK